MTFTRRLFVRWSALTSAALGALPVFRKLGAQQRQAAPREFKGLGVDRLLPLAHQVLPAELGNARISQAATRFSRWIVEYRAGEETVHPYGSERLGTTGPAPFDAWVTQLNDLDQAAGKLDPRTQPFALTTPEIRKQVLDKALASVQVPSRVPSPITAPHVAIALLAHFLESPEARNVAYSRTIDPQTCRPLTNSPKEPVALQRAGRAG
jgi:hypothetical protein